MVWSVVPVFRILSFPIELGISSMANFELPRVPLSSMMHSSNSKAECQKYC